MMPWEYSQQTGELNHNGVLVYDKGYSGAGYAKNQPDMESVKNAGPIPRGTWHIGQAYNSADVGPFAIPLSPYGHNAHGRTAFRIHGDSKANPGDASKGCIVVPLAIRKRIIASGDNILYVVR